MQMIHGNRLTPVDRIIIGAHPVDSELNCGGIIAKATMAGISVGLVDFFQFGPFEHVTNIMELSRLAASTLEVDWRCNLMLPESGIINKRALRRSLLGIVDQVSPNIIVIPDSRKGSNWHKITKQMTIDILASKRRIKRPIGEAFFMQNTLFEGSLAGSIIKFLRSRLVSKRQKSDAYISLDPRSKREGSFPSPLSNDEMVLKIKALSGYGRLPLSNSLLKRQALQSIPIGNGEPNPELLYQATTNGSFYEMFIPYGTLQVDDLASLNQVDY